MKKIFIGIRVFVLVLAMLSYQGLTVSAQDEQPVDPAPVTEETTVAPAETEAVPAETEAVPAETEAAPTEEPVVEEPPPVVAEVAPVEEPAVEDPLLAETVQVLAESGAVLSGSDGEPVPLASEEAVAIIAAGDPYFTRGGTMYYYMPLGGCGVLANCTESATPIQAALNDINSNGLPDDKTVYVEPGTYNESITISKDDLILHGDPGDPTLAGAAFGAPVLQGSGSGTGVTITGDGVKLEGFIIQGFDRGIYVNSSSGNDDIHILNNTIQDNTIGIEVASGNGNPGTEVHYNLFQDNTFALVNSQNSNNSKEVDARDNFWGCQVGPVVAYKIYSGPFWNPQFVGWGYIDWASKTVTAIPDPDCEQLYGRDGQQYDDYFTNHYSPYKIKLNETAPVECEGENCDDENSCEDNELFGRFGFPHNNDDCDDDDDDCGLDTFANNNLIGFHFPHPHGDTDDKDCEPDPCIDLDQDGVCDTEDNCPLVPNEDQADLNQNEMGDACEEPEPCLDTDDDGICDTEDNCPLVANEDQADVNENQVGDACEEPEPCTDTDDDGICDTQDNCPLVPNEGQSDEDEDGVGDECDQPDPCLDTDDDGICDDDDNCPLVPNEGQQDLNENGVGDDCEPPCPLLSDGFQSEIEVAGLFTQDRIINILDTFPCPPPDEPDDPGDDPDTPFTPFIPLTGGLTGLTCTELCREDFTTLPLPNGDQVRYYGLCAFDAIIQAELAETLPGPLPFGTFVSGYTTHLFFNDQRVDPIPEGAVMTASFVLPEGMSGENLAMLHWNEGSNAWDEVPLTGLSGTTFLGVPEGGFQSFLGPMELGTSRDSLLSYTAVENDPEALEKSDEGLPSECKDKEDCSFGTWYWDTDAKSWVLMKVAFDGAGNPIIDAHADADKLVYMNLPENFSTSRIEATVNYTGTFVLVQR